jgi:hypothetical protein
LGGGSDGHAAHLKIAANPGPRKGDFTHNCAPATQINRPAEPSVIGRDAFGLAPHQMQSAQIRIHKVQIAVQRALAERDVIPCRGALHIHRTSDISASDPQAFGVQGAGGFIQQKRAQHTAPDGHVGRVLRRTLPVTEHDPFGIGTSSQQLFFGKGDGRKRVGNICHAATLR